MLRWAQRRPTTSRNKERTHAYGHYSPALIDALNWRYATKRFDPTRKIPADVWHALEQSLVLSPSSIGLQPWKFYSSWIP